MFPFIVKVRHCLASYFFRADVANLHRVIVIKEVVSPQLEVDFANLASC